MAQRLQVHILQVSINSDLPRKFSLKHSAVHVCDVTGSRNKKITYAFRSIRTQKAFTTLNGALTHNFGAEVAWGIDFHEHTYVIYQISTANRGW